LRTKPLSRSQYRKASLRRIRAQGIKWHNCSLLSQFLNPSGKILNRLQTHLTTPMQRHIEKTIAFSRSMGLLPSCRELRAADKLDLIPLVDEVHKFDLKTIDAKTGIIINRDIQYTHTQKLEKGLNSEMPDEKKEYSYDM